jgi:hypothetical protein
MAEVTVRVTRTWDVLVPADFGDDEAALLAKATAGTIAGATESKNLVLAVGQVV